MRRLLPLALFIIISACLAKEKPEMKTVSIIAQEMGSERAGAAIMPIGSMTVGVPITRRWNKVTIDTDNGYRLELMETGDKFIVLPVNGTAQCYQEKDFTIFLDAKGKKHKFSIAKMEKLR